MGKAWHRRAAAGGVGRRSGEPVSREAYQNGDSFEDPKRRQYCYAGEQNNNDVDDTPQKNGPYISAESGMVLRSRMGIYI